MAEWWTQEVLEIVAGLGLDDDLVARRFPSSAYFAWTTRRGRRRLEPDSFNERGHDMF